MTHEIVDYQPDPYDLKTYLGDTVLLETPESVKNLKIGDEVQFLLATVAYVGHKISTGNHNANYTADLGEVICVPSNQHLTIIHKGALEYVNWTDETDIVHVGSSTNLQATVLKLTGIDNSKNKKWVFIDEKI